MLTYKFLLTHAMGEDIFSLIDLHMAQRGLSWK
jgi:hypothetical protein